MRLLLPILFVIVLILIGLAVASYRRSLIPPDLRHLSRTDRKAILADRAAQMRRQMERDDWRALEQDQARDFQRRLDSGL